MKNGEYQRLLRKARRRRSLIRELAARGTRRSLIALKFQISEARVSQIVNGK